MITLRDYQDKGVNGVRAAFSKGARRVLLVMPTGAGKTVCFSHIAQKTAGNKKKVLILAHRIELLEQCGDKLNQNEVKFGYLNPKYTPDPKQMVQVGTCQTLIRRMQKLHFVPDLIVIDEAHRSMSKTYQDIVKHYGGARVLGVTATPIRGDGQPLSDMYEQMVVGPSVKELIIRGALVEPITFAPSSPDLTGVAVVKGADGEKDYNKKQVAAKMNKPSITGSAIKYYREVAHELPAVAFCCSVQHAKDVAAEFREAGYKFEHIDGEMDNTERNEILTRLRTREIHGITSVDLVTEGFDAPMLQVAIILRPTVSMGLYIQMAGRVLRPFEGKNFAIILDHANCTKTHGLITEDREWNLTGVKKTRKQMQREQEEKVKQCPACYMMHEPAPKCPTCGHVYTIMSRQPEKVEGELIRITEDMMEKRKQVRAVRTREAVRAGDLDELIAIRDQYGYHEQWPWLVLEASNKKLGLV